MKNMSTERVIFGCFEFTLLGIPKVQRPAARTDLCPFPKEGCTKQNLTTFCRCCFVGV
jgi:hypothetical protein